MHSRAHFRLLGVPVRVEFLFILVAFMFGLQIEQLWLIFGFAILAFISILVHEMGHALTYRFFGQRSAIVLHGFGGFTVPADGGRRVLSKGKAIAVSLSGVVFQLLLLYLPTRYLLSSDWAVEQEASWFFEQNDNWTFNWWPLLSIAAFINLWWAIFNILPVLPLDGGHVAEELFGFENASRISIVTAIGAGLWALAQGWFIMMLLMAMFAFQAYQQLKRGRMGSIFDVEAPEAPPGGRGRGRGRHPGGGGGGRRARKQRRPDHLQPVQGIVGMGETQPVSADQETSIWNELRRGHADKAAALLKRSGISAGFLPPSVALAQGHAGIALDLFEAAYLKEPDGPPNLVPANLLADTDQAVPLTETLVSNRATGLPAAAAMQTHLHYAERFETAARVGELVFAADPSSPAQTAFETACSWARAGRSNEALRWVEAAVDAGFKAPSLLDGEPDLEEVRKLPGWTPIRSKLA